MKKTKLHANLEPTPDYRAMDAALAKMECGIKEFRKVMRPLFLKNRAKKKGAKNA